MDSGKYYYVDVDGSIQYDYFNEKSIYDYAMLVAKNYFRTEQEAEADKENVKEKLGLEEWIEY